MLYFVHENGHFLKSYKLVGEYEGYMVTTFDDADDALDHLKNATDIELLFVSDVLPMRQIDDPKGTSFDLAETDNGLTTGHALVRKLLTA